MATERAIVVESVYDEFVEVMKQKTAELLAVLADEDGVAEMDLSGEGPAEKVKKLVGDAVAKVCLFSFFLFFLKKNWNEQADSFNVTISVFQKGAVSLTKVHDPSRGHCSKTQPIVLEGVTSDVRSFP